MSVYSNFKVNLDNPNSAWTLLFSYIKPGAKVLDVGCSTGYFDQVLIDLKNCTVDGIELDHADAVKARKVCRQVIEGNIETLDLKATALDDNYDIIIFADVLEHLVAPAATLKKVAKVLKPGGNIIFSIPNMAHGAVRLQLLQGNLDAEKEGLLDATHLHFYTQAMVADMIAKAGLHLHELKFTTFDIPKKIVDDVLGKVGLRNTKQFQDFITSKDAVVYQFIGAVGKKAPSEPLVFGDIVTATKPRMFYDKQLKDVQRDARKTFRDMVKSNEMSNQTIHELQAENQKLRHENEQLRRSPFRRASVMLSKQAQTKDKDE
jgi:2-polyprenyl-3-methyl-5-hydroxy-6-metoxy-1,4-benzoquinol methylase